MEISQGCQQAEYYHSLAYPNISLVCQETAPPCTQHTSPYTRWNKYLMTADVTYNRLCSNLLFAAMPGKMCNTVIYNVYNSTVCKW